jgi:hypothetical protein
VPFSGCQQLRASFLQLRLLDGAVEFDKEVTLLESFTVLNTDSLYAPGNLAGKCDITVASSNV